MTLTPSRHLNIHYHYLLSLNLTGANPCDPNVTYTAVFGRSSVPYFVEHGKVVANPPLTARELALDAAVKNQALTSFNKFNTAAKVHTKM